MLKLVKTFITDAANTDLVLSMPLKKQNEDKVKEVQFKVSSPALLIVRTCTVIPVPEAFPNPHLLRR